MERTSENVLACRMDKNDAGATTVREYFVELLSVLWQEEQNFSSKRPFGKSEWQYDVYLALSQSGLIDGVTLDEWGYIDSFSRADQIAADDLIQKAIGKMSTP